MPKTMPVSEENGDNPSMRAEGEVPNSTSRLWARLPCLNTRAADGKEHGITPFSQLVGRVHSVSKDQWEELKETPRVIHTFHSDLQRPRHRRHRQRRRQRSIFGFPLINPQVPWYRKWVKMILMLDLTYTALLLPIIVGFGLRSTAWVVVDLVSASAFFVDMMLSFHAGWVVQYNLMTKVVMDGKKVAHFYVKHGNFWLDLPAALSILSEVTSLILRVADSDSSAADFLQVILIVRFFRLVRIAKLKGLLMDAINSGPTSGLVLKFFSRTAFFWMCLMYSMFILINLLGCIWHSVGFLIGELTDSWLALYYPNLSREELENLTFWERYIASIYWSMTTVTTVGYGDITPNNSKEQIVSMIVQFVGVVFFGILIGAMADVMQSASKAARKAHLKHDKMEVVEAWLKAKHFPKATSARIRNYYNEVWLRQAVRVEDSQLFQELPHSLRSEVATFLMRDTVTKMHIFSGFHGTHDRFFALLASKLIPETIAPGHDICRQGEEADRLWVLQEDSRCFISQIDQHMHMFRKMSYLVDTKDTNGSSKEQIAPYYVQYAVAGRLSSEMRALYYDQEAEVEAAPALIAGTTLLRERYPIFQLRPCGYRAVTGCTMWQLLWKDIHPLLTADKGVYQRIINAITSKLGERMEEHPELWKDDEIKQQVQEALSQLEVHEMAELDTVLTAGSHRSHARYRFSSPSSSESEAPRRRSTGDLPNWATGFKYRGMQRALYAQTSGNGMSEGRHPLNRQRTLAGIRQCSSSRRTGTRLPLGPSRLGPHQSKRAASSPSSEKVVPGELAAGNALATRIETMSGQLEAMVKVLNSLQVQVDRLVMGTQDTPRQVT